MQKEFLAKCKAVPACTSSFYRLAKISVLPTHFPSINPAEDKPYSSRPCGGMSEAWNCSGCERRTFSPPWHLTRQMGLPTPEPTVQQRAALHRLRIHPAPGAAAWAPQEQQGQAWHGAAPSGTGLITCSFDFCKRMEAFFGRCHVQREITVCWEFKWDVVYLILSSLHGSWALYPNQFR